MSFIDKGFIKNIHDKVINKVKGGSNNPSNQNGNEPSSHAEEIVRADISLRNSVKDLMIALEKLNDKKIAQEIIAEHILMLNELFKHFE